MKNILKTTIKTAVVLALTIMLFSCGSDDDSPTSQIRLTNVTTTYTNGVAPNEINFTYNAQNKLSKYNSNILVYDEEDRIIQKGNESYTYNSQGEINKITRPNTSAYINNVSNITYNLQGDIVSINTSSEQVSGGYVYRENISLDYDSNNRLISVIENSNTVNPNYIKRSLTYDSSGNIAQVTSEPSNDGITYTSGGVSSYTYDSNKNPNYDIVKNIDNKTPISIIEILPTFWLNGSNTIDVVYYYSPNNVRSSSSSLSSFQYEYVYNENNYPVSVRIERTSTHPLTSFKNYTYENY